MHANHNSHDYVGKEALFTPNNAKSWVVVRGWQPLDIILLQDNMRHYNFFDIPDKIGWKIFSRILH